MSCKRCGREQPAPASPCPECQGQYHILTCEGQRPIQIVDGKGYKIFTFEAHQDDLARQTLHNLNEPFAA
jgi:hypothetical protein